MSQLPSDQGDQQSAIQARSDFEATPSRRTKALQHELAGMSYDEQVAHLSPAPVQMSAEAAPVQMGKKSKKSGKEKGSDIPSWAKGESMQAGETPVQAATRICDEKYGAGNYKKGPNSEHNKIKKYFERKD